MSIAGPALIFAGASTAMDLMGGIFNYFASQQAAAMAESRARMIGMEAEAEAQRYAEQARLVHAKTKLSYLKSGVTLSGSPLDVLDSDILTAQENISAIRASGRAQAMDAVSAAFQARAQGRMGLLSAISGGISKMGSAFIMSAGNDARSTYDRKDIPAGSTNPNVAGGSTGWRGVPYL